MVKKTVVSERKEGFIVLTTIRRQDEKVKKKTCMEKETKVNLCLSVEVSCYSGL